MTAPAAPAPPDRLARWLWLVAAVLAVAVVGVLVWRVWPLLHPPLTARAPLDPTCDLAAGPCTVRFADGGGVTLAIEPIGIPPVTPLLVRVDLDGLPPPRAVALDFRGVDMAMGYNRVGLAAVADGAGARWQGSAMLPVCVRERMTWEALVLLDLPDGLRGAPFRFDSAR